MSETFLGKNRVYYDLTENFFSGQPKVQVIDKTQMVKNGFCASSYDFTKNYGNLKKKFFLIFWVNIKGINLCLQNKKNEAQTILFCPLSAIYSFVCGFLSGYEERRL